MTSAGERADSLTRRRARLLPVLVILFLTQQGAFFSGSHDAGGPSHVRISAWLVMSVALLLLVATGGGWAHGREVRALMNDETTRAHRQRAMAAGFLVAMVTCIGLYVLNLFEPVTGAEAVHLVMSAGLAAALLTFARLERRALRVG